MRPLAALAAAVERHAEYLLTIDDRCDPLLGPLAEFGLPSYAYCNAVLATLGEHGRRALYAKRAAHGLEICLARLVGPTGDLARPGLYWTPETVKTFLLLWDMDDSQAMDWSSRIAAIDLDESSEDFDITKSPLPWLCAEWLRLREGLSPYTLDQIDDGFAACLQNGFSRDGDGRIVPSRSDVYELSKRYYLADLLEERYNGRMKQEFGALMEALLVRTASVQLSDGTLASTDDLAYTASTSAEQCAYFTHAATYFRKRNPAYSQLAAEAARRAYDAHIRYQTALDVADLSQGELISERAVMRSSILPNGILAAQFLASAICAGFENAKSEHGTEREASVLIDRVPLCQALIHRGVYSVHVNAEPKRDNDGLGLVGVTFGPGRAFHFVSTAKYMARGYAYNLGLAHRPSSKPISIDVIAEQRFTESGAVRLGESAASVVVEGPLLDRNHAYRLAVSIGNDGVDIHESMPGLVNYKSLMIPYLRDAGAGYQTGVTWDTREVLFSHGPEKVSITFQNPFGRVFHFPEGYENCQGKCGLVRVDLEEPSEGIAYRIAIRR